MPPHQHSCLQCRSGLPLSDVSDGFDVRDGSDTSDVSDAINVTCPGCGVKYRSEPAEEGVRVYPAEGDLSLTELRLGTLRGYAKENGLIT